MMPFWIKASSLCDRIELASESERISGEIPEERHVSSDEDYVLPFINGTDFTVHCCVCVHVYDTCAKVSGHLYV